VARIVVLFDLFSVSKTPYKGLGADSEEKHEPVSDIDTVILDSLKVLDPERPSKYPPAKPGALDLGRSKRLLGSLTRPQICWAT
jgi:hypothetical protein